MNKPPCYGCKERTAQCALQNTGCERYRKWRSEFDARKESEQAHSIAEYRYNSYKRTIYEQNEKKRRHACGEE